VHLLAIRRARVRLGRLRAPKPRGMRSLAPF
jgi:hypothetical protein